jgi:hypothetical protein
MKRFLVETPHTAENCQLVIREVHAMGYLNYFEWGCESGVHCGWGFVEADEAEGARMTVPSIVRGDARVVEVTKFGPDKGRELHGM